MSTTAVPLRPVSKGGIATLWIGIIALVAAAIAWAVFVSGPPAVKLETVTAGSGPTPTADQFALINYRGTLPNGQEFDANQGVPFPVGPDSGLIPGFSQGLMQMQAGGKYKLFIPWTLAYGAAGQPPIIPPKTDLNFDVEVVRFITRAEAEQAMMQRMQQMQMQQQMQQQLQGQGGAPGGQPGHPGEAPGAH